MATSSRKTACAVTCLAAHHALNAALVSASSRTPNITCFAIRRALYQLAVSTWQIAVALTGGSFAGGDLQLAPASGAEPDL